MARNTTVQADPNAPPITQRLAETPWNPLQSYLYFGALTFFGLLLAERVRDV